MGHVAPEEAQGEGLNPRDAGFALAAITLDKGRAAAVIDGQNMRLGLSRDLGFSNDDRSENLRRASEAARLFNNSGLICVLALIAPSEEVRRRSGQVIGEENFIVVYLDAPADVCAQRNQGNRLDNAGESVPNFQQPENPQLVLDTNALNPAQCVDRIIELLKSRELID